MDSLYYSSCHEFNLMVKSTLQSLVGNSTIPTFFSKNSTCWIQIFKTNFVYKRTNFDAFCHKKALEYEEILLIWKC